MRRPIIAGLCLTIIILFAVTLTKTKEINSQVHLSEQLDQRREDFHKQMEIAQRQKQDLHLPILVYHYVEIVTDLRDTNRQSMAIPPRTFEDQMVTLRVEGYHPIHFNDLSAYFNGEKDLPTKPIILTFDDGYRDFYTDVLPILRKHHVPVTAYIVSGFLDYTQNYLTTEQFMEIAHEPLVEIAAHTVSHADLTTLNLASAQEQIVDSKQMLKKLIGRPVNHFAYPYGRYQIGTLQLVEKAGFATAVAMDLGTTQNYASRFHLKRLRPGRLTGKAFINLIETKR